MTLVGLAAIRTGTLYHCAVEGMDIAVKVADGWSADDARRTFLEFRHVGALLSDTVGVRAPTAIGWTRSPASIWTEYVRGDDFKTILSDPTILDRRGGGDFLHRCVRRMAFGLTAFHTEIEGNANRVGATQVAQLARRARLLGVDPKPVLALGPTLRVAQLYHDYSPANLRLTDDGEIYVLDPPPEPALGFPHKDLARFVRGIGRCLAAPTWDGRRAEAAEIAQSLGETFVSAYCEASGTFTGSGDHQWLMMLYETLRHWKRVNSKMIDLKFGSVMPLIQHGLGMRRRLQTTTDNSFNHYVAEMVLSGDPDRLR